MNEARSSSSRDSFRCFLSKRDARYWPDPDLDVTTAVRFHFVEIGYSAAFRAVQVALIGGPPLAFVVYELIFQLNTLFQHSNVRLPMAWERGLNFVLVTPRMHGIHHSKRFHETNANWSSVFLVVGSAARYAAPRCAAVGHRHRHRRLRTCERQHRDGGSPHAVPRAEGLLARTGGPDAQALNFGRVERSFYRKEFMMLKTFLGGSLFLLVGSATALTNDTGASPYAGLENREIKALSTDEIASYLQGKGMGFAKAAELNHHPGPAHVLTLATALALTPDQKVRTKTLFESMESEAILLGKQLIVQERELDDMFASETITEEKLQRSLEAIGLVQGRIWQGHLRTHLTQAEILDAERVRKYDALRGYAATANSPKHVHPQQH